MHIQTDVPMDQIVFGSDTRTGLEHARNEDALWLPQAVARERLARQGHLFVVADGVGGYKGGNLASQAATEALQHSYYQEETSDIKTALRRAVEAANEAIHLQASATGFADMASTVVAVVVHQDRLMLANVGDSRAYLWRQGRLTQLTKDHTWVAERVAEGTISEEEASHHQLRHVLTRSLGQNGMVEPDIHAIPLTPGDRVLLCCDGIWEALSESEINRILGSRASPQRIAQILADAAIKAGSADDVTAVVIATGDQVAGTANPAESLLQTLAAWQALSPRGFLVGAIAVGMILLAMVGLLLSTAWRALGELSAAAPTPSSQAGVVAPYTATPLPDMLSSPESSPTLDGAPDNPALADPTYTPTPSPSPPPLAPTSTPAGTLMPAAPHYCILPHTNPETNDQRAKSINELSCHEESSRSIPLDENIDIDNRSTIKDCKDQLVIIEVSYKEIPYHIFPWRIGIRDNDGVCQSIPPRTDGVEGWRVYFATPREGE